MSKVNWVCATCGQDFTRSYSANRHNNHFHYGNGIIVRFVEYVIGRINGQFPPPSAVNSNSSTRIIRKWWHNNNDNNSSGPFTGNNSNNSNGLHRDDGFTTIPDQIGYALGHATVGQPVRSSINNNMHKDISKKGPPPYRTNPFLQLPSSNPSDKPFHTKQSDSFEEFQERIIKIAEIKMLLTPYFPHQEICNILQLLVVQCINNENDNCLDQHLKKLHQTVKIRQSLDQLSSPDLPLPVNNNNSATDRATSLIGNNTFVAQNNFQNYRRSFSPTPQQPQQHGENFQPINLLSFFLPSKSLDEISKDMHKIPPKLIKINGADNDFHKFLLDQCNR
jgi:hypothetical protein